MTVQRSARAEEVLDHAMRLFAERGYGATSVAEIQEAAGMKPGSGAFYKHFPSKKAVLDAGIGRFIEDARISALELPEVEDDNLREALHGVGTIVLDRLRSDEATVRIAWRDLSAFPEMEQRVVDERLQLAFARFTAWLQDAVDQGHLEVTDPPATAAVLLGSLVFFRLMDILLGESPGQLDDARFLDVWVDLAARALTNP